MRTIKFRAWDKKRKQMIDDSYGDWISFDGKAYTEASKSYDTPNTEIELADDCILMQFTGLLDCNGLEIFEGDIVKNPVISDLWVVEFDEEEAGFFVKLIPNSGWISHGKDEKYPAYSDRASIAAETFEIIGNIYEHKHLLKEHK